ncbi:outer membrane protein X [Klebsiella pneumoniae]|nr:outer membrane protein X [Klebsiella pneumoniae]
MLLVNIPGAKKGPFAFCLGAGMQFNLIDNLALDVGYQGGHLQNASSHGFNVGVGYRF